MATLGVLIVLVLVVLCIPILIVKHDQAVDNAMWEVCPRCEMGLRLADNGYIIQPCDYCGGE